MERRKTIAVDLDNVIAKTDECIRQLIGRLSGVHLSQMEIMCWDYAQILIQKGISEVEARKVVMNAFDIFHSRNCLHAQPVEKSLATIYELSRSGFMIVIVTGRPPTITCKQLTKEWIKKYSISCSCVIMESEKATISTSWSVLIDDAPHTAISVSEKGTRVLLFDYPWNKEVPSHPLVNRVNGWDDIFRQISGGLVA